MKNRFLKGEPKLITMNVMPNKQLNISMLVNVMMQVSERTATSWV